jgi:hypothetical protein
MFDKSTMMMLKNLLPKAYRPLVETLANSQNPAADAFFMLGAAEKLEIALGNLRTRLTEGEALPAFIIDRPNAEEEIRVTIATFDESGNLSRTLHSTTLRDFLNKMMATPKAEGEADTDTTKELKNGSHPAENE